MSARQLLFHDNARDRIRRGVETLAEAVKLTLGPRGRTVLLERDFGAPQIVNSGVEEGGAPARGSAGDALSAVAVTAAALDARAAPCAIRSPFCPLTRAGPFLLCGLGNLLTCESLAGTARFRHRRVAGVAAAPASAVRTPDIPPTGGRAPAAAARPVRASGRCHPAPD